MEKRYGLLSKPNLDARGYFLLPPSIGAPLHLFDAKGREVVTTGRINSLVHGLNGTFYAFTTESGSEYTLDVMDEEEFVP